MHADLDLLCISVYCTADELLPEWPGNARRRLSDAEIVTLLVAQVLMGIPSDRRFLRAARRQLGHLFPYLPSQDALHKRRARLAESIEWLIGVFAGQSPGSRDDLLLLDSTPVECGRSLETTRRSQLAEVAGYGYFSFAEGFDSARSMQPVRIGVGGGTQTVQVSLRLTDPALAAQIFSLAVSVRSPLADVTLNSASGPGNLDQGESLSPSAPPDLGADWLLLAPQLNKLYTFTHTLDVPNLFGIPFDFKPFIHIVEDPTAATTSSAPDSTSILVPVPSLDGPTPGSGGAVFAADQAVSWSVLTNDNHELGYGALVQPINLPTSKDQCMNGGWQTFGVFKNQGDCVSYVATGGKNPPNG